MQSQLENTYLEAVQQPLGLLDSYLAENSDDPELIAESLSIDLMEDVTKLLQEKGISRSELSGLMNVSRGYVTRVLNAPPNLTLFSIARLGVALNAKPYIGLVDKKHINKRALDFEMRIADAGITYTLTGTVVPRHVTASSAGEDDIATMTGKTLSTNASTVV